MKTLRTYSLEWLDSLITVSLNPERPYRNRLQQSEIEQLLEKVPLECQQVKAELTNRIFSLYKDSQVRHIVRKYNNTLVILHDQIKRHSATIPVSVGKLHDLEMLTVHCMEELLTYVQERYAYFINASGPSLQGEDNNPLRTQAAPSKNTHKILCKLSGDQIALILRGADEAQLIKARSMNAVFKSIVPFLSTEHKENLSADSIRSKAYNPEEADREAAIAALQAVIKKIQGY